MPLYLRWVRRRKLRRREGDFGNPRRAMSIVLARHPRYR